LKKFVKCHLTYIDQYYIGAIITGNVQLVEKEILHVAVGQKGRNNASGSGGTFVVKENLNGSFSPIVIAGGAGGANYGKSRREVPWCNAELSEYGNGTMVGEKNADIGKDGKSGYREYFTGGSGYNENRYDVTDLDPKCFTGGLHGGRYQGNRIFDGGFGGGGTAGSNAGGGGYTGGHSATFVTAAGGGGSYNADPNGKSEHGWYNAGKCMINFIK